MLIHGRNFDQSFEYNRLSRYLTVNLSYNFGDQTNSRQQRRRDYGGSNSDGMDGGFF